MAATVDPMLRLEEDLRRTYIPHLRSQFQRAQRILLTGAGISVGAKSAAGKDLPTSEGMREGIWNLCFPGETFEEESTLACPFEHALKRHRNALGTLTAVMLDDASSGVSLEQVDA